MIQPEPEDLPKDNPKLEIAVLRHHGPMRQSQPFQPFRFLSQNLSHLSLRYTRYKLTSQSEINDTEYGANCSQPPRVLKPKALIDLEPRDHQNLVRTLPFPKHLLNIIMFHKLLQIPTQYHCDICQNIRVILMYSHEDGNPA
ncbi:hypothetical protein Tco_0150217 [Tanacetum coccineum]